MVKRRYHTATTIIINYFQVMVVVFGGLDEYIKDDRDPHEQPMRSYTGVLEFGNDIIIGAHSHTLK